MIFVTKISMQKIKSEKIIFLGTPQFAVPALEALFHAHYAVVAVVTKPDEPAGREQVITPPPVKIVAEKYAIPVFQPEIISRDYWIQNLPEADCFVIVAYGKLIPQDIIAIPRFGAINIHPSLLPHLRGPSPIQYAILQGEQETGVSVMLIDERMDHGPILAQKSVPIENKTGYKKLHDFLAKEGADLLCKTLPNWFSGAKKPAPQDDNKATYSKILKKDDGRINWSRSAKEIERAVRAFEFWPGSWSLWPTEKQIYRVRIEEADWNDNEPPYGSPGYVWQDTAEKSPLIKTGHGSIVLKKITIEGKKAIPSDEFLRGYPQFMGTTLI